MFLKNEEVEFDLGVDYDKIRYINHLEHIERTERINLMKNVIKSVFDKSKREYKFNIHMNYNGYEFYSNIESNDKVLCFAFDDYAVFVKEYEKIPFSSRYKHYEYDNEKYKTLEEKLSFELRKAMYQKYGDEYLNKCENVTINYLHKDAENVKKQIELIKSEDEILLNK